MSPQHTAPSFVLNPGETLWDFVTLGGTGGLGQTHTFMISGAGSVTASAVGTVPAGATAFPQVSGKDEGVAAERGLGLCVAVEVPTGACLAGSDGEIGDPWSNIRANLATYNPSIRLDFTGLTAGSTVESVTLASLQAGEAFAVFTSTDGVNFTPFSGSSGISDGSATYLPTITIPVPATTKYLLVSPNPAGGFGNNYLLQSVTTIAPPKPSTQWCSPGYWKNHPGSPPWPAGYQNLLYNSFSGLYAHAPFSFPDNPTLLQVISNPKIYKGEATNNVADIISNKVFGTPIGTGVENCPLN